MTAQPPALPITPLSQPATIRLVASAYFKPPVLSALVDSDDERAMLEAIEGLTHGRLKAQKTGRAALDARELAYGVWGASYINAAFAYTRPEGNRFNDGTRGAWYCAFEDLTAIEEVAFHRTRELERIGVFEDKAVYQGLLADFIGDFYDARALPRGTGVLGEDPGKAYPIGQSLAKTLRANGARGLIYPSVRHPQGTCLAAFHPHSVQNVRLGARWTMTWDGSPDYHVTGG